MLSLSSLSTIRLHGHTVVDDDVYSGVDLDVLRLSYVEDDDYYNHKRLRSSSSSLSASRIGIWDS